MRSTVSTLLKRAGAIVAVCAFVAGCAAGSAFRQGEAAMKRGDLDQAVAYYRKAVQASPENTNFKIALERAMQAASRYHLDRARDFEQKDQLEAALGEYRQAAEYDPSNRQAAAKVGELDRVIRERVEAARPKPPIQQMRERARAAAAEPILNPASRDPLNVRFNNASLRDILNFVASTTGINIMYDRDFADRPATVQLDGVTLETALNQILAVNGYTYKILNDRTILIFPDTVPKHAQYDEQVVRTFYVSHADATELSQILSTVIRLPGVAVQPAIVPNKTANTITVRATTSVAQIIEKIIEQNDKPRAEIVVDVEILEVDSDRIKQYGLNLSDYAVGTIFSPEVSPSSTTTPTTGTTGGTTGGTTTPTTGTGGTTTTTTGRAIAPTALGAAGAAIVPPFNLNTITQGVTTADFYLAVPTAVVKFLESDNHTRIVAKPQLRGAEGAKLTLNLGEEIPVISTSYTPIAGGGANVNPLSSYQYRPVGINMDMQPRVTLEGDILMDLTLESSSRGTDVNVAGQNIPSFGTRKVTTRLRLRDGESNLLAGLMREDESKSVSGVPGAIHVPVLKQLFSGNSEETKTSDIVMLLTPHVVRSHEITQTDLAPIYIGSQGNLNLGGPPPLIAPPEGTPAPGQPNVPEATTPARVQPATPPGQTAPAGVQPVAPPGAPGTSPPQLPPGVAAPPGTSSVPGTIAVPPAPAPTPPAVTTPPQAVETPPQTTQPTTTPPAATTLPPAGPPTVAPRPTPVAPPPITSPGLGMAQVTITPSGTTFRVGGGPYTVPLSVINAARLSTVTLTLTFDPALLRVRSVSEGTFMRSGGVNATFSQQVTGGRIDITIARAADSTGASGTGLLAVVLFDAVAPGSATLTLSGAATGPGGTPMGLQFRPVTVTVQ